MEISIAPFDVFRLPLHGSAIHTYGQQVKVAT